MGMGRGNLYVPDRGIASQMPTDAIVTLEDVPVLCLVAEGGPNGASQTFSVLEARLGGTRGRRFYGAFHPATGVYRACVSHKEDDDAEALGLERWIIPGGRYARRRMPDWMDKVMMIGPTFEEMASHNEHDPARPNIEFYRSQRELVLLLPVR